MLDSKASHKTLKQLIFNRFIRLLGFIASIRFTLVLLHLTIVFVAIATFIESREGSHAPAQELIYDHPLFSLLLCGYFLNILFSAASRYPYEARHAPFLVTHLGLLLVLSGQFLKLRYGEQLEIFLPRGKLISYGSAARGGKSEGYSLLLREKIPLEPMRSRKSSGRRIHQQEESKGAFRRFELREHQFDLSTKAIESIMLPKQKAPTPSSITPPNKTQDLGEKEIKLETEATRLVLHRASFQSEVQLALASPEQMEPGSLFSRWLEEQEELWKRENSIGPQAQKKALKEGKRASHEEREEPTTTRVLRAPFPYSKEALLSADNKEILNDTALFLGELQDFVASHLEISIELAQEEFDSSRSPPSWKLDPLNSSSFLEQLLFDEGETLDPYLGRTLPAHRLWSNLSLEFTCRPKSSPAQKVTYSLLEGQGQITSQSFALLSKQEELTMKIATRGALKLFDLGEGEYLYFWLHRGHLELGGGEYQQEKHELEKYEQGAPLHGPYLSVGKITLSTLPWLLRLDDTFAGAAVELGASPYDASYDAPDSSSNPRNTLGSSDLPIRALSPLSLAQSWKNEVLYQGFDAELFSASSASYEQLLSAWKQVVSKWLTSDTLWPSFARESPKNREQLALLCQGLELDHPQIAPLASLAQSLEHLLQKAHLHAFSSQEWMAYLRAKRWPLSAAHQRHERDPRRSAWDRVQLVLSQMQLAGALIPQATLQERPHEESLGARWAPKWSETSLKEREKIFWGLLLLSNMHPQSWLKAKEAEAPTPPKILERAKAVDRLFLPLSRQVTLKSDSASSWEFQNPKGREKLLSLALFLEDGPMKAASQELRIALDARPSPWMQPLEMQPLEKLPHSSIKRSLALVPRRVALPHHLALLEAQAIYHPSSFLPKAYRAKVLLDGEEIDLQMNQVYESARSWRFYLSSMEQSPLGSEGEAGRERAQGESGKAGLAQGARWVTLIASYDPFKYYTTYPGSALVAMGSFWLFFPRRKRTRRLGKLALGARDVGAHNKVLCEGSKTF